MRSAPNLRSQIKARKSYNIFKNVISYCLFIFLTCFHKKKMVSLFKAQLVLILFANVLIFMLFCVLNTSNCLVFETWINLPLHEWFVVNVSFWPAVLTARPWQSSECERHGNNLFKPLSQSQSSTIRLNGTELFESHADDQGVHYILLIRCYTSNE